VTPEQISALRIAANTLSWTYLALTDAEYQSFANRTLDAYRALVANFKDELAIDREAWDAATQSPSPQY
jgi:hypothetical protein